MGRSAAGRSPPRKGTRNKLETKLENAINNSRFSGLATAVEMMMEVNCPPNLHTTEGLGADNMTAIIIEFKKWDNSLQSLEIRAKLGDCFIQ